MSVVGETQARPGLVQGLVTTKSSCLGDYKGAMRAVVARKPGSHARLEFGDQFEAVYTRFDQHCASGLTTGRDHRAGPFEMRSDQPGKPGGKDRTFRRIEHLLAPDAQEQVGAAAQELANASVERSPFRVHRPVPQDRG